MKVDYLKLAVTGVKILAAIVGGAVVVMGINKLTENKTTPNTTTPQPGEEQPKHQPTPPITEYEPSEIDKVGAKVINGIRATQTAMNGIGSIVSCLSVIFNTVKNLFNKDYYNTNMMGDPNNWSGYYGQQMIPSCPWNTQPIFKGTDSYGDNIYWVRRAGNVVEVY